MYSLKKIEKLPQETRHHFKKEYDKNNLMWDPYIGGKFLVILGGLLRI
jgi:hypothetical protein